MFHAALVEGLDEEQRTEIGQILRDSSGLSTAQQQEGAKALAGAMFR